MSGDSPPTPAALSNQATSVSLPLRSLVEENAVMKAATGVAAVAKPTKLKRYQQSFGPLFKAYAIALKAKVMGGAGDMFSEDQAFFTSTSMQPGVPLKMHDAYINGRIFSLSDAMQTENCPTLGEGRHSFVQYLESYIDHVEDTSRTDEEKLRNAEEKYRAIKREASLQFELSEFKWKEALKRDPTITLDHWIEKYGYDYLDACEERAWAKTNLKRAQQTGSQDVLRQKDLMESALNSQKLLPGSRTLANNDDPPKDLVYRPLHVLPGFTFVGQDWESRGLKEGDGLSSIRIDLLEGFTRAWKDLGFPQLDNTEKSFGKKDLETIRRTIGEWKLELRYTEFQAFDVTRGLWNIPGFRTILPELARTAPAHLKKRVFQTTRILLAYNADLVLCLPPTLFTKLFPRSRVIKTPGSESEGDARPNTSTLDGLEGELLSEMFNTFPFAKVDPQPWDGENELHVRRSFNSMYPVVLGVLAQKV
ncbi:hypothetical protein CNYM01_02744 [Colletotrichum nymphaeae SA-01]|uniref:Uncharacterized protein n=1 Tax=Colletotrichum nymphaeae SA-01 TaxID=1460502 RepID=A0A135T671_9PEZI|nr:hypothetical protein CNYM01_02744 [Colletotrichum nymphaeae SA-01]